MWYARSKKYGEKNVMYDSYAWYNHMLSDSSQMKNMPEVGMLKLKLLRYSRVEDGRLRH